MALFPNFYHGPRHMHSLSNSSSAKGLVSTTQALFLLVLTTVFLGLTVQAPERCFANDDFAIIHTAKHMGLSGTKAYFSSLPNDKVVLPTHDERESKMSFLSVSYRPLMLVIYALEYPLLGDDAHSYFLLSIFLHALASALLFLVFLMFASRFWAVSLAILFGFFPFMTKCAGRIALQSYSLSVIFLVLSFFVLKKAIESERLSLLALSGLLFAVPVFIHEQVVVLPAWIALAIFFYLKAHKNESLKKSLMDTVKFTAPFALIVLFYLGLRLFMFGFSAQSNGIFDPLEIWTKLKVRHLDLLTFVTDTFGLTFLPPKHPFLKGGLLLFEALVAIAAFIVCRQKKLFLVLVSGFLLLCWPSILLKHESRYIYVSLPLLLAALALCLQGATASLLERLTTKTLKTFSILLAMVGFYECRRNVSAFCQFYGPSTKAIEEFAKELPPETKSVFFLGVPKDFIRRFGVAQALWFYSSQPGSRPEVHFDEYLNVLCNETDSVYNKVPSQNLVKINVDGQRVSLESADPAKAWFEHSGPFKNHYDCLIGELESIHKVDGRRADKVCVDVKQVDLSQSVLASWNFEKQRIEILGRDPASDET